MPPAELLDPGNVDIAFMPGPAVVDWIRAVLLDQASPLYEEHAHLVYAEIGVLWTSIDYVRQMCRVAATAEIPAFRCSAWQKGRQEQQLRQWFGRIPDFLITISAGYAATCTDAQFCAVVEHELYHCAQERDFGGAPKFRMDGRPAFAIRGHEVEEFVGVVRRYGVGAAAGQTAALVAAALTAPEIAELDITSVCGTCQQKAA